MEQSYSIENNPPPNVKKGLFRGWIRALIFLFAFFTVMGVVQTLTFVSFGKNNSELAGFVAQLGSLIGTILVLFIFMRWIDREPFINLGFSTKAHKLDGFWGILVGFVLIIAGFLILYALGYLKIKNIDFDFSQFVWIVLFFVMVAINEEMIMRGYILRNLMQSMNKYIALIISALIFSVMHFFNPDFSWLGFFNIFLAGLLLGVSYIYTRNLWFPIGLHFGWNFMQSFIGFNVSGMDAYSLINITPQGDKLWSGGAFGFEGSLMSIVVMVVGIDAIYFHYSKKKQTSETIY